MPKIKQAKKKIAFISILNTPKRDSNSDYDKTTLNLTVFITLIHEIIIKIIDRFK